MRLASLIIILLSLPAGLAVGQELDFSPPVKLPPGVNSDQNESAPLLSEDGSTLYFIRSGSVQNEGGKFAGTDAWVSHFNTTTNDWGRAVNDELPNDKGNNAVVGVNSRRRVVYMLNTTSSKIPKGIYFLQRTETGWSRPELVPIKGLSSEGFLGIYVSPDFDVMFVSMKGPDSRGEEDLYLSLKGADGQWSALQNLGATINTSGFEISPFLSADKTRLFFSSNGHPGSGDADIFYSDRLYNSWETWTVPKNLGTQVNSPKFDAYFSLQRDSSAYFVSNRGGKSDDIYRTKAKLRPSAATATYLTEKETEELLGIKVIRKIEFAPQVATLTSPQRELIWFLTNKLVSKHEIRVQLQYFDKEDELTSKRLLEVINQLVLAGIDGSRIDKLSKGGKGAGKDQIELVLMRQTMER
ncbi:WD40-like Beta Propeller Repeat [Chryseolinea serpens]|uniref:WD40-like Beta Propeller Repeat n=1 Tax=Chryseolinea serpens TaxID=947013 RepID=A0A1M5VU77_9BACT|nr:PD40 domain-containing protein [Chryseolinea serpens]SHH78806.1 WD40-like Beta Propeller Repeat [Chryseolinea serpens]